MTVARRTRRSMTVAFAAAYMLVLQSLLGAFTFGMGTVGQTDTFGNVICTHAGPAEQPRPDPHQQTPSCCILGCAFSGLGLGTPPEAAPAPTLAFAERIVHPSPDTERSPFSRHRWQANPRAPPALA